MISPEIQLENTEIPTNIKIFVNVNVNTYDPWYNEELFKSSKNKAMFKIIFYYHLNNLLLKLDKINYNKQSNIVILILESPDKKKYSLELSLYQFIKDIKKYIPHAYMMNLY